MSFIGLTPGIDFTKICRQVKDAGTECLAKNSPFNLTNIFFHSLGTKVKLKIVSFSPNAAVHHLPNLCAEKRFIFSACKKFGRKCWWNRPLIKILLPPDFTFRGWSLFTKRFAESFLNSLFTKRTSRFWDLFGFVPFQFFSKFKSYFSLPLTSYFNNLPNILN